MNPKLVDPVSATTKTTLPISPCPDVTTRDTPLSATLAVTEETDRTAIVEDPNRPAIRDMLEELMVLIFVAPDRCTEEIIPAPEARATFMAPESF